ncbi:hypothetical protein DYBT9275_00276 [Dyadobacter sp. CECT 9275]|uniref:Uncharacterized protein n=1 Tax=Dyadobacter helix TaxID=2822344 RepID=A0A916J940_9BACT|nr:hypothetical protein DYBT9275_00276 [Dyadobacter sp. CECT 9275]
MIIRKAGINKLLKILLQGGYAFINTKDFLKYLFINSLPGHNFIRCTKFVNFFQFKK